MSILGAYIMPHPPIMLPEIGRGEERKIQSTIDGCMKIAEHLAAIRPETVVLISPHTSWHRDCFIISTDDSIRWNLSKFGFSGFNMKSHIDVEFATALENNAQKAEIPTIAFSGNSKTESDHSTIVPLYHINKRYSNYKLVRISLAGFGPEMCRNFGSVIAETAISLNRRTVFIASGDLSHKLLPEGPYGYASEGPLFDATIGKIIRSGITDDFLTIDPDMAEAAATCGLRAFWILAGVVSGLNFSSQLLSLEGPFGVGYGTAIFEPREDESIRPDGFSSANVLPHAAEPDPFVALAKTTLENRVRSGKTLSLPAWLPAEMREKKAGVFVSLHIGEALRGCMGTIEPTTDSIAEEIIQNAVWAGTEDPRFDPVRPEELDAITYNVDVLSEPESISSTDELDVKKYGVIVTDGHRRGLLLPDLDGIDTVKDQVDIARRKAGIAPWEKLELQRFLVIRHSGKNPEGGTCH